MITFTQLREAVKSADKKPENYKDPSVSEKTLTPAEKKKREEIAKAMERENPGMDMSKKMAIATATAKKVAEAKVVRGGYRDSQGKWHPSQTRDDILRQRAAKKAEIHGKMKGAMRKEEVELDEANKEYGPGHIGAIQKMLDKEREAKKAKDAMKKEEVELDEVSSELAQRVYKKRMDQSSAALKRDDYSGMRKAEKKAGATHLRMIKKILKR